HVHAPRVSVREQAHLVVKRLRRVRTTTFRSLTADAPDVVTTVARFLALLELYREGVVAFEQAAPLAELTIRWSGSDEGEVEVGDEFDEPAGGNGGDEASSAADSDPDATSDGGGGAADVVEPAPTSEEHQ